MMASTNPDRGISALTDNSAGLSTAQILSPRWQEFVMAAAAAILAAIGFGYADSGAEWLSYLAPATLTFALVTGAIQLVRRSIATIWTPLLWIRIALAAYVGIGSLVPYFLNDETRRLISSFYDAYPGEVAKYNLVNSVFYLLLIAFAYLFFNARIGRGGPRFAFEPSHLRRDIFGLLLIAVGFAVQFLFIVPASLGLIAGTAPLFLNELSFAADIGIFFITSSMLEKRPKLVWLPILSALILSGSGVLLFNKSAALLPLVMVAMAFIYHKPNLLRILGFGTVLFLTYSLLTPLVSYGRIEVQGSALDEVQASISERTDAIYRYIDGDRSYGQTQEIQGGWARLSYVNAGTFAINQFDSDQPGDSLRYAPIVWIPRLIYPEKPIITDIARDFNYAASGSDTSASTPGLPSEGYWNYGWWGVVLFAALLAGLFAIWSSYTIAVLQSGAWHLFFVVLMGMRLGGRVDGMMVSDIMGPLGLAILGHIALQFLNRLIVRRDPEFRAPSVA